MLVIILSTLYFSTVGIANGGFADYMGTNPPLNIILFAIVPIKTLNENTEKVSLRKLFSSKACWILCIIMVCAGGSELAMSQWSSLFAEKGLAVSKTMGDLLGPCAFAFLMGLSGFSSGLKAQSSI